MTSGLLHGVLLQEREQLSRKLRISLVDRCNLSCVFCHNDGQGKLTQDAAAMSVSELRTIVSSAVEAGIREIKLSGGEPLLYRHAGRGVVDLVSELNELRSGEPFGLSMTTNGLLLARHAKALATAGLDRVTVSLHSLDDEVFHSIARPRGAGVGVSDVLDGIRAAAAANLRPIKVNTVLVRPNPESRGNLSELEDMIRQFKKLSVDEVRFYSLLAHEAFPSFDKWYQYWNHELIEAISRGLYGGLSEALPFADDLRAFLTAFEAQVYPKPTFVASYDGLSVAIEPMANGRFDQQDMSDEGPYALRLSAKGQLTGTLNGLPFALSPLDAIRGGASSEELVAIFTSARQSLLPSE